MFKLAYNSNGFIQYRLEEAIGHLAEIGFEGVEVSLHRDHLDPLYHSDTYLDNIKAALDRSGMKIVALHTGGKNVCSEIDFEPSLISDSKKDRLRRIEFIVKSVELANLLEVPCVTITSGIKPPAISTEEAYKNLYESLDLLFDSVDKYDVDISIENEIGMLIENSDQVNRLIGKYPGQLGATLDIGHLECCKEDICEAISMLGNTIRHMHFEDIKDNIHYHLIPGQGDINFHQVIKDITHSDYNGFCSVELYTHNDSAMDSAKKSFDYLNQIKLDLR